MGIPADGTIAPKLMVAADRFCDFFATLAKRDPDGLTLPLRIGATLESDEYCAFGLAWKSTPNLRASFVRSTRCGHVLGNAKAFSL